MKSDKSDKSDASDRSDRSDGPPLHKNEGIKEASGYLRGELAASLADRISGAVSAEDAQLTKFHGIYLQDDRDERAERRKKKLDKAYSFMVRVRVPGAWHRRSSGWTWTTLRTSTRTGR